ncbi:hypothetical protein [Variovorax sp. YR566]|uniref:hypothetical protein n=1 Tax=Variovorax sp. YR566 TaxID=3450237 RepID=UPI003F7EDB76
MNTPAQGSAKLARWRGSLQKWLPGWIHQEPVDRPTDDEAFEYYDDSFTYFRAMAPVVWQAIVGALMLIMLCGVGYFSESGTLPPLDWLKDAAQSNAMDSGARRAALAFSGVTAAITMALSIASVVWAVAAFRHKDSSYRWKVIIWAAVLWVMPLALLGVMWWRDLLPFTTRIGAYLLPGPVPFIMLGLACTVSAALAAGAGFLLQPTRRPNNPAQATKQLQWLAKRLIELDQLLYVGALALVFGTLQLSTAMSAPLAGLPKTADLKNWVELCKTLAPPPATSPFFPSAPLPQELGAAAQAAGPENCKTLPEKYARNEVADDLRQLVRGVTLACGLAFSALLAAIYVPALIGLRLIIERPLEMVSATSKRSPAVGEMDPIRRIAAVAATLSPLIAGLLANALSVA